MAKRKTKARSIYITKEPDWKTLLLVEGEEEQKEAFSKCDYFARTEIPSKKKIEAAKKWIKEHSEWDKDEIKTILANPDWAFSSSAHFWIFFKLGYMPNRLLEHIEKRKEEWMKRGKKELAEKVAKAEEKKAKNVISIQDRMKMQVNDICASWEHYIDMLLDEEFSVKDFDPYKEMIVYQPEIKGPHAKIIKEDFESQYQEALEVAEWKDPELKEAYSHFDAKMRKDFVELFEKINTACDTIIQTKATTRRARKPKARSKEAIVKKMKYQINDSDLGVASIHPTEVAHANELWVYNTKTRKIGVYHAINKDPRGMGRDGLMVKGTTIQDFCEKTSLQKTLRKPKEQINNWTGKATTKFAKAFDDLTTTGIKMNGRMNDSTIILQAF